MANGGPVANVRARTDERASHADAVQSMFDRIAPTYDMLNHVMSGGIDILWRKRAVAALEKAPPGAILDLCAGTLDTSAMLARKFPERRIVAADFSREMLAKGRNKAPTAEVVVADAMDLPFADGEFSAVICAFGMRNLAEPSRGVAEVKRVLAKGGVFVTLEFFKPTTWVARAFHAAYGRVVLPRVGGLISRDSEAYSYLAQSIDGFLSCDDYEALLARSQFQSITSESLTFAIGSIVHARMDL